MKPNYNQKASLLIISLIAITLLTVITSADVVIFPTQTAKLNTTGISGNTLPVTYTWYNECPTCGSYSAFPNSNSVVYYWITNSLTATGKWSVFVNAKDTGTNSVNSVVVNVLIINYSYTYNGPLLLTGNVISVLVGNGLTVNTLGYLTANNVGGSSGSIPIILSTAPAQPYSIPFEGISFVVSLIFFALAMLESTRRDKKGAPMGNGSALQIGLFIVAAALMYFAVNYTLLPNYPASLQSNGITVTGSTSLTIGPYAINTVINSAPVAEEVYIKEVVAYLYMAICMIFLLAGVLARFGYLE